ncbi:MULTISPECIES: hypothetical protein [unclassified Pseudomonas]|uniref:hypothetical protein n=1 Tax=unclassified Pseudomonas TaxID=196821 RepID=UPI00211764D0|nr:MULTISPECIES: hypothetical protein [unclassified Pseudomonas]
MKNKIEDLRNHLFVTIESLLDTDKPMEIGRAKAIAEVAQVMINSAKVEVEMVKALGAGNGTGFLQIEQEPPK